MFVQMADATTIYTMDNSIGFCQELIQWKMLYTLYCTIQSLINWDQLFTATATAKSMLTLVRTTHNVVSVSVRDIRKFVRLHLGLQRHDSLIT